MNNIPKNERETKFRFVYVLFLFVFVFFMHVITNFEGEDKTNSIWFAE